MTGLPPSKERRQTYDSVLNSYLDYLSVFPTSCLVRFSALESSGQCLACQEPVGP